MNTIYRKFLRTTLFAFLLVLFTTSFAQYPVRPNVKNANGERIGEWIIFYDSTYDKSFDRPDSAYYYLLAKFKDGKPQGRVESFRMNGLKNWSGYLLSLDPTIRHGQATSYYANGNILEEAIFQYDSLHGMARTYHENGMLSAVGEFRNNKREGYWEEYYSNGNIRYKGSHKNDKPEGIWEMYHENGVFKSKGLFQRGLGQGYWEYYYDNGKLQSKGVLKDNNFEGRWLEYHDNGNLAEDILYKDDLKHGKYIGYHSNGNLEVTGYYLQGKAHGDFVFYHDNGKKFSVGRKENDELIGIWENYHPNGQLKSVGPFENDKRHGTWKFYSEDGWLETIATILEDQWQGQATYYSAKGLVKSKGSYLNDKKEGEWMYYDDDGVLIDKATYVQDLYHGPVESYHSDGTLAYKGLMQNDKKEGDWVFYYDDGTATEGSYRADLMHGYFKRYHATGALSDEGNYIEDQRDGLWKYYYENGALKATGNYKLGLKEGVWRYFSAEGQLQVEGNYEQGISKGTWKYYYENGKLKKMGEEIADEPVGLWTYYDEDGDKNYEGYWHYGKKHGEWRAISKSGAVTGRDFYNFDKILNFQTYYDSVMNLSVEGKIAQATAVFNLAKEAYKKEYGMGPKYSEIYEMQGYIARQAGDYKNALKWYQKALDIVLKFKSDTSSWYVFTLPNLGHTYVDMEKYQEAKAVYQRVIDLLNKREDRSLDGSYPTYLNYLASAMSYTGEVKQAIDLLQAEIEKMEREGFAAENILVSKSFLTRFAEDLADNPLVITTAESLLDFAERNGIEKDWHLAMAYYRKGRALNAQGRYAEALENYILSRDMYRASDSLGIPYINTLLRIGDNYYSTSDYANSTKYYKMALDRAQQYGLQSEHVYRYSLFSYGKVLFSAGKTAEALDILTKFVSLETSIPNPDANALSEGYLALGMVQANLGAKYYDQAEANYRKAMAVFSPNGPLNYNYVHAGKMYGIFLTEKRENYAKSNELLRAMLAYGKKFAPDDKMLLTQNFSGLANNFYYADQNDSALYYYSTILNTLDAKDPYNFGTLETTYGRLASLYIDMRDYVKAQAYHFQALELIERVHGKDNIFYGTRLRDIGTNFNNQANYPASIDYYRRASQVFEKLFGTTDLYYLNTQVYLAESLRDNDQVKESLSMLLGVKKSMESMGVQASSHYVRCLSELASTYNSNEQPIEADATYQLVLKTANHVFGEGHSQYARYIRQYGNYLAEKGKYDQAYTYLQEALNFAEKTYGRTTLYAWYATDLSTVQMSREKYVDALELREAVAEIYNKQTGQSDDYMNAKFRIAEVYRTMGRYPEAVKTYEEVANIVQKNVGGFSYAMTQPLTEISDTYYLWKKPQEGLKYAFRVKDLYDSIGVNPWNYVELYGKLGLLSYQSGQIDESKKFGLRAVEIADSLWGKESEKTLVHRNNLAFSYMAEGDFATAEKLWLLAGTKFNQKSVGDLSRVRWLDNMSALYTSWNRLDKAAPYWSEIMTILITRITADFSRLSESGKAAFWDANKDNFEFFNTYGIKAAAKNKVEVIGQMYDNQLVTKGILLSTSTKERKRILNSGDSTLVANYFRYTDLKDQLARYYGYTKEQLETEKISIPALEQQAARLEKVLSMDAEALSVEEKSKAVRWRTIQRSLKPGEAAMEIIRFRYFDRIITDSVMYAALILTPETKLAPKLVLLPNGNALENQYVKAYKSSIQFKLKDERSYAQFWQAIDQELKGVKQLYLSLDGVFNQINIGTLLKPDGTYVRDAYNMRLLSSTRDMLLIQPTAKPTDRTAYLFGFPKYDLAHATIENMLEERGMSRSRDIDQTADLERFGFTELPGTKTETEEITRLLESKNWLTNLYLSDKALEEDLKAVSNPSVLHIATHGFFLDDVQKKEGALELGVRADVSRENPLLRSGLLLTGAAQTARGEINPGIENGIFTAYEAMNLNLQQTELVVLSACETGRGEIKNGEGVYGLQRAFQIAGAEAIIMSLWKVDDAATQMLMTEFYRAWTTGMTKADALRSAQDVVKASYGHPYYWGAFVLVGQ